MKWKLRFGAALGNTLEYYDIAVFAAISIYLSAELERLGYVQATEMIWGIFALRFLIRPIGGYVIGRYADNAGKKSALVLTSLITGIATLCMALLPIQLLGTYTPLVILILQLALSFSFAGEFPSLVIYLLNSAKNNERGRVSSMAVGSSVLGIIISLGLVLTLQSNLDEETMQSIGWRIPLFLGVINIAVSFWFRSKLPSQPTMSNKLYKINWYLVFHVILLTIPGTVIFYAQNISTSLILEYLKIGEYKNIYAISLSGLLLIFMTFCGWWTDKYSSSIKVFKAGVMGMILFSAPLYFVLNSDILFFILLSQLLMTIYSSMILCNLSAVLADYSNGQVTILGIGYNCSAAFLGGITPLMVNYLSDFNLAFVGGFIAICGLAFFISYWLPKSKSLELN
ncbi:MFS transporter [Providencia sp.]|uniref:MFS transporter n=1 Tax=Providencia sp. TaxID=589 RepID=UPI003F9DB4F9